MRTRHCNRRAHFFATSFNVGSLPERFGGKAEDQSAIAGSQETDPTANAQSFAPRGESRPARCALSSQNGKRGLFVRHAASLPDLSPLNPGRLAWKTPLIDIP